MNKINNRAIFEALEYVLYKKMEKEAEAMLRLCPTVEHDEECYRAVKAQIDEHFKKLERKALKSRVIVAIVAAVLALLTSCAVIFREEIGGFIVSFFDDHADFGHEKPPLSVIDVYYEPTYIPDGFDYIDGMKMPITVAYYYKNGANEEIRIEQLLLSNSSFTLDTENAEHGTRMIGETAVYYSIKKSTCTLVWRNETCIFLLMCPDSFSWEEIERIILGIQPIGSDSIGSESE